jgi:hypothetical protein
VALIGLNTERCTHFLVNSHFDRAAYVSVDQLTQQDSFDMRSSRLPGTFAHGAFLRWPPCQAAR